MKQLLAALTLSVCALGTSAQTSPTGYPEAPLIPGPEPEQIVRQGIDRLTGFLIGARDPQPEMIQEFLRREIAPTFDFAYMARWAAGPLHRRMSETQRTRLSDKLSELFLGAFARNLGSFARPLPRIEVFAARPGRSAGESMVPARVVLASGFVARLEFRFYWSGTAWRIFDVVANGASAVAFYRRYFGDLLRRQGPDALLD